MQILLKLWLIIGNRTLCHPIRSVIVSWLNKSDSRYVVVLNHSYDYRPNWTPLSPVIITYYYDYDYDYFAL